MAMCSALQHHAAFRVTAIPI